MNRRKLAFQKGLTTLRGTKAPLLARTPGRICALGPSLYNAAHMLQPNQVVKGDCIELLNAGQEGTIDLVFADPPFNIGYLYHGYNDKRNDKDYCAFSKDWMAAVHRALKPNGSFYLAIGDEYAADLCVIARRELGFNLRNWIIWHYTFGQQTKRMFAKSHTHILYFTKDEKEFTFNPDAVRVASARQTTYADSRANPKGKLPDDTWYLRPQETPAEFFAPDSDTWNVSRVCGTFKEREGWHGCQMPIGVLNRIIQASSNPGDIVLDPFNGSGTTVVAAALLDRRYVGIDQSEEYVSYARKRLQHALEMKEKSAGPMAAAAIDIRAIADPTRASKVMTGTDAFGRPRVTRRRAAKTA
ncbi:MAG TPA: site-specific DNA-methyltransferase [Tepidisphaeraceae bacterium]|nr:site-specific DNA-methyltransferase [Tepidisphaeraceae bacterium]